MKILHLNLQKIATIKCMNQHYSTNLKYDRYELLWIWHDKSWEASASIVIQCPSQASHSCSKVQFQSSNSLGVQLQLHNLTSVTHAISKDTSPYHISAKIFWFPKHSVVVIESLILFRVCWMNHSTFQSTRSTWWLSLCVHTSLVIGHYLIISRDRLILTLSVLIGLEGWISWSIPMEWMDSWRESVRYSTKTWEVLGNPSLWPSIFFSGFALQRMSLIWLTSTVMSSLLSTMMCPLVIND